MSLASKEETTAFTKEVFLREKLGKLEPLFQVAGQDLKDRLPEQITSLLYEVPPDSPYLLFFLSGAQAIDRLGPDSLNARLSANGLNPARFMSQPPAAFDCVLVPVQSEVSGSGYYFFWSADQLSPEEVYYLLAHAWAHLVLGHLRPGDPFSHWDVLSDLRNLAGPTRRWDKTIQNLLPSWYIPLAQEEPWQSPEWRLPNFAIAIDRLINRRWDFPALSVLAAASRYTSQLVHLNQDIIQAAQLFPHQRRGAVELVVRLQRLGVALLADSVGLGKTRTTATLIRLMQQYKLIGQAAILTPLKLERNWREEFKQLGLTVGQTDNRRAGFDVMVVNKDKFKRLEPAQAQALVKGCDLLVIEEAHQDLRNWNTKFHRNLRAAAAGKYGLLVTATPWNNQRGDIFSMLFPFATNNLGNARPTQAWECFGRGLKEGQKNFETDHEAFRLIYAATALQRTRRQLREGGESAGVYYAPRRPYLINVPYSPEQTAAFTKLLEKIEGLLLPQVNFLQYLQTDREENHLSGFQRFTLLKRAESSMFAFGRSLQKLTNKTSEFLKELQRIEDNEEKISSWLRQRLHLEESTVEEEVNPETSAEVIKPRFNSQRSRKLLEEAERQGALRSVRFSLISDCAGDLLLLREIKTEFAGLLKADPKLEVVMEQVKGAIANGRKVLCISQYADTARAVYQFLLKQPLLRQKGVGFVTGGQVQADGFEPVQINGLNAKREEVLRRFAPQSWGRNAGFATNRTGQPPLPENVDILVGSDTLSVGQNLQDARVLINLDLCWNPMQHEQRIGRIDRPRHASDSAPLDIYYFLNLELIESELKLRKTIERRLEATYQDTDFDDEVLPGYFEMIEEFRRLRQEQPADQTMINEADDILQDIAERSARPEEVTIAKSELEREALLRLKEWATQYSGTEKIPVSDRLLVTAGQVPLYDNQNALRPNLPQIALVAEIEFMPVDSLQRPAGNPSYRHYYLDLKATDPASVDRIAVQDHENQAISFNDELIAPVVDGLLADPTSQGLNRVQARQVQILLADLQEHVERELEFQRKNLHQSNRRMRAFNTLDEQSGDTQPQSIEVRLINLKGLF